MIRENYVTFQFWCPRVTFCWQMPCTFICLVPLPAYPLAELSSCDSLCGSQSQKYSLPGLLLKKFADSCLMA